MPVALIVLAQVVMAGVAAPSHAVETPVAPLKATLVATRPAGCEATEITSDPSAARDVAAGRRLLAEAQDAALEGDRPRARTLLEQARARDPRDERIALELSRVEEELFARDAALVSSCRGLRVATSARVREELEARRDRLVAPARRQASREAQSRFAAGLAAARERQWRLAAEAFADAARLEPSAPEAAFNQGVVRIMAGERAAAIAPWERYLELAPAAPERLAIARTFATLRRPTYSPGASFARGLLPGGGQFATGRPAAGVLVLGMVAGAGVLAARAVERERLVPYVDPNGQSVPYRERYTARPYLTPALAGAGVITLAAALEARAFARRSNAPVRLAIVPDAHGWRVALRWPL